MTAEISLEQARQLLLQAVETQGREFVYQDCPGSGCFNVPVGELPVDFDGHRKVIPEDSNKRKTGCLVGTAMKLSGVVPEEDFPKTGTVDRFERWLSRDAYRYFDIAQTRQDNGDSWGAAYDHAEAYVAPMLTYGVAA